MIASATDQPASNNSPPAPGSSRFTIEQRGIDHVPTNERHGSVRSVALMWSGAMMNVTGIVFGTLLVLLGLNFWQAVAAILIGNATWIITGMCSLPGPAAGTTTFAASRAPFGRNGNRPIALCNWIMQIGYESLDLVLMFLATSVLLGQVGIELGATLEVVVILVLAVTQSILPVFGLSVIMKAIRILLIPFTVLFAILIVLVFDSVAVDTTTASGGVALFFAGVALAASGSGLGWTPNAADYARYLPASTSRVRLVAGTALGGAMPQILLMTLGAAVATAVPDAVDPISGLPSALPPWFLVPYLLVVLLQLTALNAINLYSSGMTLQAMGIRVSRWQAVVIDAVVCAIIAIVVTFSGDFNALLGNFLLLMIVWFAPWAAIMVADYFLRSGRYDIASLSGDGGAYRRIRGLNPAGVTSQVAGMIAALLCINTTVFTGPISSALDGTDLSVPAGLIVGATAYWALARKSTRKESKLTERLSA
ncbi:purine-cytosine permease family protein [Rhodococcus sp. 114MFTsu3.1]|uniref:purine-cytosine permease family protein n=1 Tax=Rhodococcus sp. 114MFTsu3.1 TaxID=1172184 RepID=UPI00035D106E|nr:cytosine permease [Rhodococcus sp. 114MFTsu3.1]